jgi:hypothetical protein
VKNRHLSDIPAELQTVDRYHNESPLRTPPIR